MFYYFSRQVAKGKDAKYLVVGESLFKKIILGELFV